MRVIEFTIFYAFFIFFIFCKESPYNKVPIEAYIEECSVTDFSRIRERAAKRRDCIRRDVVEPRHSPNVRTIFSRVRCTIRSSSHRYHPNPGYSIEKCQSGKYFRWFEQLAQLLVPVIALRQPKWKRMKPHINYTFTFNMIE